VLVAGIIWIGFGSLSIAGALLQLILPFGGQAGPPPGPGGAVGAAGVRTGGACGALFGVLFGAVFLHAGLQSVRGKASDVLGNGVGSLLFGVLYTAFAAVIVMFEAAEPSQRVTLGFILVLALALYVAGALALVARSEYKEFHQSIERPREWH
jgi:hypothetical protein